MRRFAILCLVTAGACLPVKLSAGVDVPGYLPLRPGETSLYNERGQAVLTGIVYLDWLKVRAFERISWKCEPGSANLETGVSDYLFFHRDSLFWAGRRVLNRKIVDIDTTKSRMWPGYTVHNKKDSLLVRAFFQFTPPVVLGDASSTAGQVVTTRTVVHEPFSGTNRTAEIQVSLDSVGEVSVPAGIFDNCIRLKAQLDNEDLFNWVLAEGAGVIRGWELEPFGGSPVACSLLEIRKAAAFEDSSGGAPVLLLHENCPPRAGAAPAAGEKSSRTGNPVVSRLDFESLRQLLAQVRFWENQEKRMSLSPLSGRGAGRLQSENALTLRVYRPFFGPFSSFTPEPVPMRLSVPADSLGDRTSLEILAESGRLLRTLYKGPLGPCRNDIFWDGNDFQGREIPNGEYTVRLLSGDYKIARKFVILK